MRTLFLILIALWGTNAVSQNMMFYTSEAYSFTVELPEEWKRSDMAKSEAVALVMQSPEGATLDITFYELTNMNKDQFMERFELLLESSYDKLVLQEKGVIKARDDEATYLVFDYETDAGRMKEKVCFYNREGEMTLITGKHSEEDFHDASPVFDKVFKSFTYETDQEKIEGDL